MAKTRRVIVLCDGTWCGRETDTKSNIYFLAQMIGVHLDKTPAENTLSENVRARYFDGVGLGGDFMSYLWNGALATQAKRECTEVYRFIVENFASDTEVWMFGISRGAYIVRSVAGMINNCGIVKENGLIDQVYDLYQSAHTVNQPWSPEMIQFRNEVSHKVETPIKFMGLFDTVGSRGVPRLNYHTGTGFEWPEFHDTDVSSEVENVYHAVAIHDRFWAFQPCLTSRATKHNNVGKLKINQKWFPGCHYDLARQEFQFLREGGSRLENFLFPVLKKFSDTVFPNEQLADLVLLWMLEGINTVGGGAIIQLDMANRQRDITRAISDIKRKIALGRRGTGDMYERILDYLPGGRILFPTAWFKNLHKTTYAILFTPVDRVIPDPGDPLRSGVYNEVYNFIAPESYLPHNMSIEESAGVNLGRYPSQTYQNYRRYMEAIGKPAH